MQQTARERLADNLAALMSGHPILNSQNAIARKSGVAQTTIGYMLRPHVHTGSPKLDNIERIAEAFGITVSELLAEQTGETVGKGDEKTKRSPPQTPPPFEPLGMSHRAQSIIERLAELESAGASSPQLLSAIEAVLELVAPVASNDGYPGLNKLRPE